GLRGARKLKQGALYLYVGIDVHAQVEAIGSFDLVLPNGLVICLDNCHYAPTITKGVVSVSRLIDNGFIQCFTDYGISVSKNDVLYFNVISWDGIYEIDMLNLVANVNSIYNVSNKRAKQNLDSTYLWHCRPSHISKKCIKKMQHDELLTSMDDESFDQCVSCLSGKMIRKPFLHRTERATDLLGPIHTDVCGPLRHVSRQVENQIGKTVKALRSDRGGEYISQEFKDYLKAYGIVQQLTPPYTPQHNDDYALESATRILNMVPTKKAPVKRDTTDKVQQRSVKCIFIGHPNEIIDYYFYFPPENKIVIARYVEFLEKNLISQEISGRAVELEEIQDDNTSPSENTSEIPREVESFEPPQEEVIHVRRSVRTRRAPECLCLNVEVKEHSLGDLNEPTNYKVAMLDPESDKWLDAMNAKMQSMKDNQVWCLVDLPPNGKTVRSKWIFKKKTDMNGIVHTYKARLVVKDFTQTFRVDYKKRSHPLLTLELLGFL
ncbi:retrotransposon protein, putative, ty1-copia subclass, partial [Tanacetum coccineum]